MNTQLNQKAPGRNDPCPCGSGKKYKKCCMLNEQAPRRATPAVHPDLPKAISAIEGGNPQAAREICQSILSTNPEDAGALHIYGMAAYQLGAIQQAEDAFRHSLATDPENPWVNNNLAIILQEQDRLEEAYPFAKKAIELDQKNPDAHINLGNIYRKGSHLAEAEAAFEDALKRDKKNFIALTNLGEIYLKLGKLEDAKKQFNLALKYDAHYLPALNNLGVVLNKLEEYEEALKILTRASDLAPDDAEILMNIGLSHKGLKDYEQAESFYKQALDKNPHYAAAIVNLGDLALEREDKVAARSWYEQAIKADPKLPQAHVRLADMLLYQNEYEASHEHYFAALDFDPIYLDGIKGFAKWCYKQEKNKSALQSLDKAIEIYPDDPELYSLSAQIHKDEYRLHDALSSIERAIKLAPSSPSLKLIQAEIYKHFGKVEEARKCYQEASKFQEGQAATVLSWAKFEETCSNLEQSEQLLEKALELDSTNEPAVRYYKAIIRRRQKRLDEAYSVISNINIDAETDPEFAKLVCFEKANILDKRGEYKSAFPFYQRGAELRKKSRNSHFDPSEFRKRIDDEIEFYAPELLTRLPTWQGDATSVKPIFVVGFPRSGTTLLEQILCSHPNISAGGELIFIREIAQSTNIDLESELSFPYCLSKLAGNNDDAQALLDKWRRIYIDRAKDIGVVTEGVQKFTDKMPMNLRNLALISMIFPDSPIIHIMRNPMDSALSSMFSNFEHKMEWANNIEYAAHFYYQTIRLVDHFRENLKMNYLLLRYEDLVADQEKWSREVIDFVDEEWDDRCLAFHKSQRIARTASYAQVNQKMYTSSVARYKNYEEYLKEPLKILRPVMENYGYFDK